MNASLHDQISNVMKEQLPKMLAHKAATDRSNFELYAEPMFGQDGEFNYDEEATLP